MPTLAKAQSIESDSPWGAAFDQMYLGLCRDRVSILIALGFYAEHDLPPPEENSDAIPTTNEEEELRQIASALTVAAAASAAMPAGVLAATRLTVSKNPGLFFTRELPAPVEWAIACDYQRGGEPPGTHWRDVWGDQVAAFPGEVEQLTDVNIAKAAGAATLVKQDPHRPRRTAVPSVQSSLGFRAAFGTPCPSRPLSSCACSIGAVSPGVMCIQNDLASGS
ncbi:hypothetical protein [Bradyrhizobium sp. AZCC 2289]|uniref:hypothetical protein n=1 Tax=Bradyrhizobium sp. AZCC 2289 TaxID=3117026 RepID=UPI002FEF9EFF